MKRGILQVAHKGSFPVLQYLLLTFKKQNPGVMLVRLVQQKKLKVLKLPVGPVGINLTPCKI